MHVSCVLLGMLCYHPGMLCVARYAGLPARYVVLPGHPEVTSLVCCVAKCAGLPAQYAVLPSQYAVFPGMLGYQVERLAIASLLDVAGPSVTHQRGKRSRSEDGTDEVRVFIFND